LASVNLKREQLWLAVFLKCTEALIFYVQIAFQGGTRHFQGVPRMRGPLQSHQEPPILCKVSHFLYILRRDYRHKSDRLAPLAPEIIPTNGSKLDNLVSDSKQPRSMLAFPGSLRSSDEVPS